MPRLHAAAVLSFAAATSASASVSFWDFNLFSRSSIGSSSQGYTSSVQGATGAVGNAWLSSFTVRSGSSFPIGLRGGFYGGGDLTLSGSANGGVFTQGNVIVNNATINGGVNAGGNLGGSGGTVNGGAKVGGAKTAGNALGVNGAMKTGQAYNAPIDLAGAAAYFQDVSTTVATAPTSAGYTNQWGNLLITTTGALTIVDVSLADFQGAWGVTVTGAGTVVVNVDGASASFASKTWAYNSGASANSTLLNFAEATSIAMSGGHAVNILAPNASVTFSSGVVTGNLIVGSLMGGGSIAWNGGFTSSASIPAPSSSLALLTLGAGLARRARSQRGARGR